MLSADFKWAQGEIFDLATVAMQLVKALLHAAEIVPALRAEAHATRMAVKQGYP